MKILDALLEIEEKAINGCIDEIYGGICYNLYKITGEFDVAYDFVENNCSDWKLFSGDINYPIECYGEEPLWEGKQLELRLSLIDHLIAIAKELGV